MNAADITELFGRGVPATLDTAMIVDVCAYLRSTQSPVTLVLSARGESKGVLSHRDIVHTSGRLGSSVMQMSAGELVREQAPVCQKTTPLIEVLELLTETGTDFVLVCDGSTVVGVISLQDVAELLMQALGGETSAAEAAPQPEAAAQAAPAEAFQPEVAQVQQAPQVFAPQQQFAPVAGATEFQQAPQAFVAQQQPAPVAVATEVQQQLQPAVAPVQAHSPVPDVPPASAFAPVQQPAMQPAAPAYAPQPDVPVQTQPAAVHQPQQAAPVQQGWASFST